MVEKIRLTEYAKTHEEECFLQFIVDEKRWNVALCEASKIKSG